MSEIQKGEQSLPQRTETPKPNNNASTKAEGAQSHGYLGSGATMIIGVIIILGVATWGIKKAHEYYKARKEKKDEPAGTDPAN